MDAIDSVQAQVTAEAGTVTRVVSESFAGLDDRPPSVEMEIRASWTPTDDDPARHLQAWLSLVCTIAGLPPLPDGVVALPDSVADLRLDQRPGRPRPRWPRTMVG